MSYPKKLIKDASGSEYWAYEVVVNHNGRSLVLHIDKEIAELAPDVIDSEIEAAKLALEAA